MVWPTLVQGSNAPAFRGSGDGPLLCSNCGHVLVEGYVPRLFAAVDFECFLCRGITRTLSWPSGEPLPATVVSLGESGRFLIGGTVDQRGRAVVLAPAQEIARVEKESGAQPASAVGQIELSPEGLVALESKLGETLDGFQVCMRRVRNAIQRGNQRFLNCPPAWALAQLQRSVADGVLDLNAADGSALATLHSLVGLLPRWQHHERFAAIRAALVSEFNHSMAQLLAASYLADAGNRIGFGQPAPGGGRSPDMFINIDAHTRHSIEVKAPTELQWPAATPSRDRLARIVEQKLRATRGQITSVGGGVVVLGASIGEPGFEALIRSVIEELARNDGISTRISGVAVVSRSLSPDVRRTVNGLNLTTSAEVFAIRNPRYFGPGGLVTGD